MCDWLPGIIEREADDANGWRMFEEEVYSQFEWDFVKSKPTLEGKPVYIELEKIDGKEKSFWHVVTRDFLQNGDRVLEPIRAERIGWIRAMIESRNHPQIRTWDRVKNEKLRRYIWLFEFDHLVVLGEGRTAWWLVTAFWVEFEHERRKLEKEWSEHKNG